MRLEELSKFHCACQVIGNVESGRRQLPLFEELVHNLRVCSNPHWQGNLFQLWFPFCRTKNSFCLLALFPISCSSLLMSTYVPRITKSGINKGFSPCLVPAFCWRPRNTCGSLSIRERVVELSVAGDLPDPLKSVVQRAKIESSSVPAPSIVFRISSRPPSFARVLVVLESFRRSSFLSHLSALTFSKPLQKYTSGPRLDPGFLNRWKSGVLRPPRYQYPLFFSTSMVASFSWLTSHQDLKSKAVIF